MNSLDGAIQVLISEEQIKQAVHRIAQNIRNDYAGKKPVLICVLKGAVMFYADLCRALQNIPLKMEFITLSSYHGDRKPADTVDATLSITNPLQNKDLIVVEDIIDTGNSMRTLIPLLEKEKPESIAIASLLKKRALKEQHLGVTTYYGLIVDDFVVGYGMDLHEQYRNLPCICTLE